MVKFLRVAFAFTFFIALAVVSVGAVAVGFYGGQALISRITDSDPGEAIAYAPAKQEWDRYVSPLMPLGHSVVVGTTQATVTATAGATLVNETDAWFFRDGDLIVVQCPLEACFCFTQEDEISVVTMGSGTTCGNMTDSGTPADGQGVCFRVPAGSRRDVKVSLAAWFGYSAVASTSYPGHRSASCSQSSGTYGYPCDAADDCVNSAGGVGLCEGSAPLGVFLMAEAAVATNCSVEVER
jgi:hypothetical protein